MSLPSISALIALEALDRLGTVEAAAGEMNLTRSAVSHKLRQLSKLLGFPVTRPDGRGVKLTTEAADYLATVRPALDVIRSASPHRARPTGGKLRVNCAPGFAASWISRNLSGFLVRNEAVDLHFASPTGYGDLGRFQDDIYITFAKPDELPKAAELLLDVEFFPVCSPVLHSRHEGFRRAGEIGKAVLLHLETERDWRLWLESANRDPSTAGTGVTFQEFPIMYAATLAGQGISLGDSVTSSSALASGQLVQPFSHTIKAERSYYLVPGKSGYSPAAEAFRMWLTHSFRN